MTWRSMFPMVVQRPVRTTMAKTSSSASPSVHTCIATTDLTHVVQPIWPAMVLMTLQRRAYSPVDAAFMSALPWLQGCHRKGHAKAKLGTRCKLAMYILDTTCPLSAVQHAEAWQIA